MNNTKWDEIRLAMHALDPRPAWSTTSTRGYRSSPDREWFYRFQEGGYSDILHLDILVDSPEQRDRVRAALQRIGVPGEELSGGFRVFGYLNPHQHGAYL
ncbi:hypothetical protein NS2R_22370 [Pseudomonas oryzihabitans]|nr:hypothetical protein NS2R_22370 [Pseudomonas psychrotolerans]